MVVRCASRLAKGGRRSSKSSSRPMAARGSMCAARALTHSSAHRALRVALGPRVCRARWEWIGARRRARRSRAPRAAAASQSGNPSHHGRDFAHAPAPVMRGHSREAFASCRPLPFRSAVSGGTYGPRGYSSTLTVGCTHPSGGGEPRPRQMAYGANSCLSMRIAGAPRARFLKLRLHKRGNLQRVYDIRHATHRRMRAHRRMEAHASASARLANEWRALSRIVRCYSHRRVRLQCARGVRRARRSVEEARRKAAADHCSWCTARRRCCTCIVRWARSA